jgi:hypothetical protein
MREHDVGERSFCSRQGDSDVQKAKVRLSRIGIRAATSVQAADQQREECSWRWYDEEINGKFIKCAGFAINLEIWDGMRRPRITEGARYGGAWGILDT